MPIKIENHTGGKLPGNAEVVIHRLFKLLPKEHYRGIERLRFVDSIRHPGVRTDSAIKLPALYHPKQPPQQAWLEVSGEALFAPIAPLWKRLTSRLSFKSNLAAIIFSLVGQHYHLTMRHSIKRGQLEAAVRVYTEKYLKEWGQQEHRLRARLFKPLEPWLHKWAKNLQKQAQKERKKSSRSTSG